MSKGEIAYFCQLRCEKVEAKDRKEWLELTEVLNNFKDVLADQKITTRPEDKPSHQSSTGIAAGEHTSVSVPTFLEE